MVQNVSAFAFYTWKKPVPAVTSTWVGSVFTGKNLNMAATIIIPAVFVGLVVKAILDAKKKKNSEKMCDRTSCADTTAGTSGSNANSTSCSHESRSSSSSSCDTDHCDNHDAHSSRLSSVAYTPEDVTYERNFENAYTSSALVEGWQ